MTESLHDRGGRAPSVAGERRVLDRDIWAMAWPAMLSLLMTNVVDLIDVAFVGRLGREPVAAYGYAAQYLHLVQMVVQSVGIGCVALMARAVGAGDAQRARRVLGGSVLLAQAIAAGAALTVAFGAPALLFLLDAQSDVVALGAPYFRLSACSMLLYAVSFMFESALRAHKLTRVPMQIALVVAATKIALSYGLIFGAMGLPRLGLLGAAVSSVCAHAVGLGLYLVAARIACRGGLAVAFGFSDLLAGGGVVRDVLRVSLPAIGERVIMSLALLSYFAILSHYGTAAIAAYAIGVRLLAFSWVPGLGFATAASTFVGQALGAGDSDGAKRAAARAVTLSLAVMSVLGLICFVARDPLARVFTHDEGVIAHLLPFMLMLAIAQPFMGVHFTLGGVLRGAGDTVTPLIGAALGNWLFRVPLAALYANVLGLELTWVWSALIADHVARMVYNGAAFFRGRWAERTGVAVRAE